MKPPTYGDKLMGISPEKAVGAVKHALAKCDARHVSRMAADYKAKFVPAFMAYLGLTDVKKVPARSTLDLVYRSHLARKEEETLNAQHETHNNSSDASDSESDDSDKDDKSDDFVASDSDDDAAATTTVTAAVQRAPLRRLRNVPKSARELLREKLAPVRDALDKAKTALEKASRDKNRTGLALQALGLSGDGLRGGGFAFDDRDYAIRQAKRALPDVVFNPEKIVDARTVWRSVIVYHQRLGDDELEKQIAATRARCDDLTFERLSAKPQNAHAAAVATRAAAVAASKRRKIDEDAEAEALESLKADDFADDQGVRLPPNSTFHRSVVPLPVELLPDHVAPDPTQLVWARDAETQKPVLIKAGEMQEKWIFGRASVFQLGIGMNKDQEPIGEIVRDAAGDAVLMRRNAWNGYPLDDDRYVTHRGRRGPLALCFDLRDRASTWARGGHDDMTLVPSKLGLKLVSSKAVKTTVGTLEDFQHARFESTTIPGGLEALLTDCEVLSEKMRAASMEAKGGVVFLAPGLQLERLGSEGTVRCNIVTYSRCAGSMNALTKLKLNYLESQGLMALHHVSLKAALLGHVQVRLVAYAHAAAGNFHPDGSIVGPIRSNLMATSAANAAPANLRSWNFSSGIGSAMPAHMGPAFG